MKRFWILGSWNFKGLRMVNDYHMYINSFYLCSKNKIYEKKIKKQLHFYQYLKKILSFNHFAVPTNTYKKRCSNPAVHVRWQLCVTFNLELSPVAPKLPDSVDYDRHFVSPAWHHRIHCTTVSIAGYKKFKHQLKVEKSDCIIKLFTFLINLNVDITYAQRYVLFLYSRFWNRKL